MHSLKLAFQWNSSRQLILAACAYIASILMHYARQMIQKWSRTLVYLEVARRFDQRCLFNHKKIVNMVDNSKYVPPQGSHEWTVTHGLVDYCIASCGNLTGSFFANRDDLDLLMPNNQEGSLHFYWLVKPDGFYINLDNSRWDQKANWTLIQECLVGLFFWWEYIL